MPRRRPRSPAVILALAVTGWLTPTLALCLQAAPQAPSQSQPTVAPPSQSLTAEERQKILNELKALVSDDQMAAISRMSDGDLSMINKMKSQAVGAAPGQAHTLRPPPLPIIISIQNPLEQAATLRLDYGSLFCGKEAVALPAQSVTAVKLCKKPAKVRIDGNPPTVKPGEIGKRSCYALGRFANPPRLALDACPP